MWRKCIQELVAMVVIGDGGIVLVQPYRHVRL